MNRALKFTIWHGMAASLALHSAVALPFVVNNLAPPPEDSEVLVVELQGMVSDVQAEEKVAQLPDQSQPSQPPPPQEAPPPETQEEDSTSAPEPQPQVSALQPPAPVQARHVKDPDEQQKAQMLKAERDLEADRLRKYVMRLSKKVRANLIKSGLHGDAMVSLTVVDDGHIKPGTLRIAQSSGQPKLDASALATVRASAPFEPPPYEMNLNFNVGYGKNK
jgi:protein TonB